MQVETRNSIFAVQEDDAGNRKVIGIRTKNSGPLSELHEHILKHKPQLHTTLEIGEVMRGWDWCSSEVLAIEG